MTKQVRRSVLVWTGAVVGLLLASLAVYVLFTPAPDLVQGQVEAAQVDVAAKIPGRVQSLAVREGQLVRQGDLLAVLETPEIDARVEQATAAERVARAQNDKAERGAREEEVRQARSLWLRARHGADLARTTFERLERLHKDGVIPAQRRDEAEAQWLTAEDAAAAARAACDMAEAGSRAEDKVAAEAALARARGGVAEAHAFLKEAKITAPIGGEVTRRNAEAGELVSPGFPVLTIVDLTDVWVTFHLREDRLAGLRLGDRVDVTVPALGGKKLGLEVFSIAPQGDFATWRSTSASGGFDLKTFEVRARPQTPEGLRPGMSAVVRWDRRG